MNRYLLLFFAIVVFMSKQVYCAERLLSEDESREMVFVSDIDVVRASYFGNCNGSDCGTVSLVEITEPSHGLELKTMRFRVKAVSADITFYGINAEKLFIVGYSQKKECESYKIKKGEVCEFYFTGMLSGKYDSKTCIRLDYLDGNGNKLSSEVRLWPIINVDPMLFNFLEDQILSLRNISPGSIKNLKVFLLDGIKEEYEKADAMKESIIKIDADNCARIRPDRSCNITIPAKKKCDHFQLRTLYFKFTINNKEQSFETFLSDVNTVGDLFSVADEETCSYVDGCVVGSDRNDIDEKLDLGFPPSGAV